MDVRNASDFVESEQFARRHNLRFVIKNTVTISAEEALAKAFFYFGHITSTLPISFLI